MIWWALIAGLLTAFDYWYRSQPPVRLTVSRSESASSPCGFEEVIASFGPWPVQEV
jgi:hypothetical protein